MTTRARLAARGAGAGLVALILTWYAAFHLSLAARADRAVLAGFAGLHRPRVDAVTQFIADLCDPKPYVFLAAVPVLVALIRGRRRLAVLVVAVMMSASVITEALKPLLATAHPLRVSGVVASGVSSWPSGHATAAMALALCAVVVVPGRLRPAVGAVMAAFTVAVCYSFLELGWHYPSDVIGGFLIAGVTMLSGIAGLELYERRRTPATVGTPGLTTAPERISVLAALRPALILTAAASVLAAAVCVARPHSVLAYASRHPAFILGAPAIAACGLLLAVALILGLDRTTAARRPTLAAGAERGPEPGAAQR